MPKNSIKKVAIIGAGVMGSGIAAQIANSGTQVLLLDIVPKNTADKNTTGKEAEDRNIITKTALTKLKKSKPAAFMHAKNAGLISIGNTEDDLEKLADCDWIIEVVLENLEIKQALYKKIQKHRKKTAIISSNTSTLPLDMLTKGMPKSFCENFLITHFFNPPRYMRLLEIVVGKQTNPKVVETIGNFADISLGKSVVNCNDTPGFIANRIGTYWMQVAITKAFSQNIQVEAADAMLSRPMGVPRTGVFGLLDLVGLDLMPHILDSLGGALKKNDPFKKLDGAPQLMLEMIADGYTGRKGKGGFYRLNKQRKKEVIDLQTGEYSLAKRQQPAAAKAAKKGGLLGLLTHNSPEGRYAQDVILGTLNYAASLVPEIAENIEAVDRAMRLGYNWKMGPFELIDKIGVTKFAQMLEERGEKLPHLVKIAEGRSFYRNHNGKLQYLDIKGEYCDVLRPDGVLLLADIKRKSKPIATNMSASLWDLGDKVACLEFHSKMNSLNLFTLLMVEKAIKEIPKRGFKALVIHNEATNFSVGANIAMLLATSGLRFWTAIRYILWRGQTTFNKLKYAPFPVVAAPSGMALGGGCEVLLHCDAIEAHAESYMGLVEAGVGIVPGWGGCKEMLQRAATAKNAPKGPMPAVIKTFQTIAMATVATSAAEAKDLQFLRESDNIVMNRDRILANAKAKALELAENYRPPEPFIYKLPGKGGATALKIAIGDFVKKGVATPHDATIATELAGVLTGGDCDINDEISEKDILSLERDAIINLAKTKQTRDRIKHMLFKGRPLRN